MPTEIWFEDEYGVVQEQMVKYEWQPVQFQQCKGYGHELTQCRKPIMKDRQPKQKQIRKQQMCPEEVEVSKRPEAEGNISVAIQVNEKQISRTITQQKDKEQVGGKITKQGEIINGKGKPSVNMEG
ncbi:OLC1v1031289C1 [Oldenlandia corymbosa var. corymbosa]|uniref:OLC1v1031289C1 n=1 Tax=Oldenlandia corymbosa var. corymbosa TaxID=529605 RepID=A0AAV1CJ01_OLDCO|nr:OLC1v1031289C1 [Oldenlandia corymbosa var. corymbosa]